MMDNSPTGWHTVHGDRYNGEGPDRDRQRHRHAPARMADACRAQHVPVMYCRAWNTSDGDNAWIVNQPPGAPEPGAGADDPALDGLHTDRTGRTWPDLRHTWREWSRRLDPDRRQAETEIPY